MTTSLTMPSLNGERMKARHSWYNIQAKVRNAGVSQCHLATKILWTWRSLVRCWRTQTFWNRKHCIWKDSASMTAMRDVGDDTGRTIERVELLITSHYGYGCFVAPHNERKEHRAMCVQILGYLILHDVQPYIFSMTEWNTSLLDPMPNHRTWGLRKLSHQCCWIYGMGWGRICWRSQAWQVAVAEQAEDHKRRACTLASSISGG
jgi:hypothetical protein